MTKRAIMWFRRDLRLGDHPAILAAASDGTEVVPVFVIDTKFDGAGAPRRALLHGPRPADVAVPSAQTQCPGHAKNQDISF